MRRLSAFGILAFAGLFAGCRSDRSWVQATDRMPPPSRALTRPSNEAPRARQESSPGPIELVANPSKEVKPAGEPADLPLMDAKDFAETKAESFAPGGLSPISPALMLDAGTIPKGYDARLEELERVGKALANASSADITYRFDTIYNPRSASTCHTEAGHILVTSSLLERLQTRHQLATALALEMAELVEEKRQSREKVEAARAGVPEGSFATLVADDRATSRIEATAANLLAAAGFESIDLAAMQQDLASLGGRVEHSSAKPAKSEPAWNGPTSSAAN